MLYLYYPIIETSTLPMCLIAFSQVKKVSRIMFKWLPRSLVAVLRSAGDYKKINQTEDEHYIISKALQAK